MGKKLAIEHHLIRPNEVIELLEMMGGKNTDNADGCSFLYYTLCTPKINNPNNDKVICGFTNLKMQNNHFAIFTLEKFWKKYPYKVGDKVVYEDDNDIVVISEIIWDDNVGDIFYNVKRIDEDDCFLCPPELLKPYKERKMNKKLAIKGHSTRGKEVIEILKMLGGKNNCDSPADNLGLCYLIDDEFDICAHYFGYDDYEDGELNIFTLEEFLEKYPFKVGDKVVYTKFGDNCDDYPVTIESMKWMGTTIEYTFNDCVTCLAKDLKMWEEKPNEVISGIYLNSCDYADEVELNLGDYEIEVRDGKTYAVKKKPKYPKTYVECCKVLGISYRAQLSYTNPEVECSNIYLTKEKHLLDTFMKLRICRNAYWKIAGEEMGLDKPWEPDWNDESQKYCIRMDRNKIVNCSSSFNNRILAFPTEEMRNIFYENFKDLIEQCKENL